MENRPTWCPDKSCLCLYLRADRLCFGRLAKKAYDPDYEIWNTHQTCCQGLYEQQQFNAVDAYFDCTGKILCLKDILAHGLYNPCPDQAIPDPLGALERKLKGV